MVRVVIEGLDPMKAKFFKGEVFYLMFVDDALGTLTFKAKKAFASGGEIVLEKIEEQ